MGDKTATYIFVLVMTVSFPALLTIGLTVTNLAHVRRTGPAPHPPATSTAEVDHRTPSSTGSSTANATRQRDMEARNTGSNLSPETMTPRTERTVPTPVSLDAQTTSHLSQLKQEYYRRIEDLARHRDRDIAALARGLSQLPSGEAADLVRDLDDELVARALHLLQAEQRRQVLTAFPFERSQRIERLIRHLSPG